MSGHRMRARRQRTQGRYAVAVCGLCDRPAPARYEARVRWMSTDGGTWQTHRASICAACMDRMRSEHRASTFDLAPLLLRDVLTTAPAHRLTG